MECYGKQARGPLGGVLSFHENIDRSTSPWDTTITEGNKSNLNKTNYNYKASGTTPRTYPSLLKKSLP